MISGAKASSGASAWSGGGGSVALAARRRGARGLPGGDLARGGSGGGSGRGWRGMGARRWRRGMGAQAGPARAAAGEHRSRLQQAGNAAIETKRANDDRDAGDQPQVPSAQTWTALAVPLPQALPAGRSPTASGRRSALVPRWSATPGRARARPVRPRRARRSHRRRRTSRPRRGDPPGIVDIRRPLPRPRPMRATTRWPPPGMRRARPRRTPDAPSSRPAAASVRR